MFNISYHPTFFSFSLPIVSRLTFDCNGVGKIYLSSDFLKILFACLDPVNVNIFQIFSIFGFLLFVDMFWKQHLNVKLLFNFNGFDVLWKSHDEPRDFSVPSARALLYLFRCLICIPYYTSLNLRGLTPLFDLSLLLTTLEDLSLPHLFFCLF